MDDRHINYGFFFTCAITILGWGVTFGVCQNKIENNAKEIARLERQRDQDKGEMRTISDQLTKLNTKMDLLLDGRLLVVKEHQ